VLITGKNGRYKKLAIVGSHPATRHLAPYDDPSFEIWLFNESAMKPEVYKRWDSVLQIHKEEVYASLTNWVNKDHWAWLQEDHGPDKRIFMQDADLRVPNSVRYPLEDVLALVPYHYLRSSPAIALALAIYLGYQEIWLYGSELTSNTEYGYQACNYAFWIGFAHGRGIDLHLECWHSEFYEQPLYGYEGEPQLDREYFIARVSEHGQAARHNEKALVQAKSKLEDAMLKSDFEKTGSLSLEVEEAAMVTGESVGALSEAERYAARTDMISRQEFERVSAQAQIAGDKSQKDTAHSGGKCEYVWNVWKQTGNIQALQQLRLFLTEKTDRAYETGRQLGIFRENLMYMGEYDKRVTALGGERARIAVGL
jgi:hypothetical protein